MITRQASERFGKLLEGFSIINATITAKDRIVFITKDDGGEEGEFLDDAELATDFILYNPKYNNDKHGISGKRWGQGIKRAWGVCLGNEKQATVFCDKVSTCEFTSDEKWIENTGWQDLPLPPNTLQRGIWGCTKIDNDIYMFGRFRKLYRRTGPQQWQDLSDETEHPNLHAELIRRIQQKKSMITVDVGFLSLDGFSNKDIYGCGDGSDLWHYDGRNWQRLDPPTNFDMHAILCAPDGYVYVAGALGTILKGRYDKTTGEHWQRLDTPITDIIYSLAWFQGKVYIGVSSGLYTIDKDGTVEAYQFPDDGAHQYSFRNVASCDEALLSYGADQALVFDGLSWEPIIGKMILPIPEVFL